MKFKVKAFPARSLILEPIVESNQSISMNSKILKELEDHWKKHLKTNPNIAFSRKETLRRPRGI